MLLFKRLQRFNDFNLALDTLQALDSKEFVSKRNDAELLVIIIDKALNLWSKHKKTTDFAELKCRDTIV